VAVSDRHTLDPVINRVHERAVAWTCRRASVARSHGQEFRVNLIGCAALHFIGDGMAFVPKVAVSPKISRPT
jgi:hypothetical protein